MAEETQKPAPSATEVVAEQPPETKEAPAPEAKAAAEPEPEAEKPAAAEVHEEKDVKKAEDKKLASSVSFKEETNVVGDLPEGQKKALEELKKLVQEALEKHQFYAVEKKEEAKAVEESKKEEAKTEEAKAEEPKTEEAKTEEPKAEEAKTEEPKSGEAKPEEPKAEEVKTEEKKTEEAKPEEKIKETSEETEPVKPETSEVVAVASEVTTVADDGAKTVEAIKETVVAVCSVETKQEEEVPKQPEEVCIYGIPLLADERSDTILLKFLRARDFKVKEAFAMLKNTVKWRKEFGVDALLDEDLGHDWDKVIFMHGCDKEGHPVCYNVYGEFMDKELYQKTFGDEEKRNKFIKFVIQSLEKSVRNLDFSPNGISTILQVNDLRNSPGLLKWELRQTTDKALQLLQDNYPEFVAKQVFINVPWWYLAFYTVISPFLTERTRSKFVIASTAKSADTLFKYIAPEQVPHQYGGLISEGKQEFSTADAATEVTLKPSSKHTLELPVTEKCHFVWELRVIGWEVSYGAEFVPSAEDSYTVIVQKSRKIASSDEPVIFNGYKVSESGKIVVTIENHTNKKKKLLYRTKSLPISG